ncbi:MAG: hypothetical protein JNN08_32325, partial [Bryobacterales bacterium]|nr:hypothetical protein [Bryobacterales bacterium]
WIGFFAQDKLKRIEATGGAAQTLCDVTAPRGGTWNAAGVIVFSGTTGLFRVPAHGGAPSPLTTLDLANGETGHTEPVFLAGGRHYLYRINGRKAARRGIYLGTLDGNEGTRLLGDLSSPGYTEGPAGGGYLLFVRAGTLMAQRLDAAKGALVGEAFPVA